MHVYFQQVTVAGASVVVHNVRREAEEKVAKEDAERKRKEDRERRIREIKELHESNVRRQVRATNAFFFISSSIN